jgi:hypothetical protein
MKNKKILYGLLGIGAIAGFYFWNKNKMPKKSKEQINCEKENKLYNANTKICKEKMWEA